MKTLIRLRRALFDAMRADLHRSHRFAYERVGFLYGKMETLSQGTVLILPTEYLPVRDDDYVNDPSVGARINRTSIFGAIEKVLATGQCGLHVHCHEHSGQPGFSATDVAMLRGFSPALHGVQPQTRHGGLVLSHDGAAALVWDCEQAALVTARVSIVGAPLWLGRQKTEGTFV
jgi:hypothetical protein